MMTSAGATPSYPTTILLPLAGGPSGFLSADWQGDGFAGYGSFTNLPVGSGGLCEAFGGA